MQTNGNEILDGGKLTIGLDLGDRSGSDCVLNAAGQIALEHKLATTPEALKQVFGSLPRSRIAMETGTHSPWVSRLLTALGTETRGARREKRQETGGGSSGTKVGGTAASVVGDGRDVRTVAQEPEDDPYSGIGQPGRESLYRTAELDRRVQVTATKSWPKLPSYQKGSEGR